MSKNSRKQKESRWIRPQKILFGNNDYNLDAAGYSAPSMCSSGSTAGSCGTGGAQNVGTACTSGHSAAAGCITGTIVAE